jgi:hypothetical protein
VTAGITTWEEMGHLQRPVLFIMNSREPDNCAAAAVAEVLERTATDALHVIAEVSWREWLVGHGVPGLSIREARDHAGSPLELNYFLEIPATVRWVASKRFKVLIGSSRHSLYNEEVKTIFERRVALLVGAEAHLLAHALPHRYLYVFDLAMLLERIGREEKMAHYETATRKLVADLFAMWKSKGSPTRTDCDRFDDVLPVLEAHLGGGLLGYDEQSPIPIRMPAGMNPLAEMVSECRDQLVDLAGRYAGRTSLVALQDEAMTFMREARRRLKRQRRRLP